MTSAPLLHRALGCALGCALAALLGTAPAAAAPPLPDGALRVQRVDFIDRQGFDKPLVAATIMVPAGWQQEATVEWNVRQRCTRPHALRLRARASDGSAAIELVPGEGWGQTSQGAPMSDCPQATWRNTREYLAAWVQRNRPGARWLDYRLRSDKSQPEQRQTSPGGGSFSQRVESGQALIAYSEGGRELRETLVANVAFTQSRLMMVGQNQALQTLQGQSFGVLAWRAPAGTLDMRQFDAVWDTLRPGAEWQARIDKANADMAADNQRTQAEIGRIHAATQRETMAHIALRGQIRAQTQRDVAAIRNNTTQSGQASNDRMHTDSVRTVREVQGYRDPRSPWWPAPWRWPGWPLSRWPQPWPRTASTATRRRVNNAGRLRPQHRPCQLRRCHQPPTRPRPPPQSARISASPPPTACTPARCTGPRQTRSRAHSWSPPKAWCNC